MVSASLLSPPLRREGERQPERRLQLSQQRPPVRSAQQGLRYRNDMGISRSNLNMAGIGDPQIAVWTVSADIKLDALGQRKIVAEIDGAGDPPHVRLPSVGPGLAPATGFLLAAKRATNLRARWSYVDVCDAAIRADHVEEFLHLMHVGQNTS